MRTVKSVMLLWLLLLVPSGSATGNQRSEREAATSKQYQLVMADLNDRWTAIRYHPRSGHSVIIANDVWVKIKEAEDFKPDSKAVFVVKLTSFRNGADFAAIRLDKHSGATWFLRDRRWVPIAEFEE